jgi:hypothetical protein
MWHPSLVTSSVHHTYMKSNSASELKDPREPTLLVLLDAQVPPCPVCSDHRFPPLLLATKLTLALEAVQFFLLNCTIPILDFPPWRGPGSEVFLSFQHDHIT